MPEGTYVATARLTEDVWRRSRWFSKIVKRVEIEIPSGIPLAGKGESSWDCGDNAIYSMCSPAKSIGEGVGRLVGTLLHDRVRYGGYEDWKWNRHRGGEENIVS